jgi:membrane associated rhomboid family serine protease
MQKVQSISKMGACKPGFRASMAGPPLHSPRSTAGVLRRLGVSAALPPLLLALSWGQELIDQLFFAGRFNLPMQPGGPFSGVFTAPFSHAGFEHLLANSVWFLPLSWLVLLQGRRAYLAVWLGVLLAAIPVWLFWPLGSHGLSGVNYGLLGYLLLIGWLEKRPLSLALSVFALLSYGALLPSLLPFLSPPGVSWIGHASGFLGGLLAALAIHREP